MYLEKITQMTKSKVFVFLMMTILVIHANAATSYCVLSGGTLTFYCDDSQASRKGTKYALDRTDDYPKWHGKATSVTKVVFDPSFAEARPTNGNYWLDGMTKLTSISGMENFNTSEMDSMAYMFSKCKQLTQIDLSHLNTNKAVTMRGMFYNCSALTSLNLSNFNTRNVDDMAFMFYLCSGLESVVVGDFNTSKVQYLNGMFFGCSSLISIDVSRWDVSKVGTMSMMHVV